MKKSIYALFRTGTFLLVLILALNSCKKDDTYLKKEDSSFLSNWYENHVLNSDNNSEFKNYKPVWDHIYLNGKGKELVFEIELENPQILVLTTSPSQIEGMKSHTNTRLLIFQDKETKRIKYASYMYLEGDGRESLSEVHYKQLQDFTGKITYFHQSGKMANGWIYDNGKAVASITEISKESYQSLQKGSSSSSGGKVMNTTTECRGQFVQSYFWGCITVGSGPQNCGWHSSGTTYITVCRTVQLGGEDETIDYIENDNPGGYWPDNLDCKGVENGSAFETDACGCIGGTTGITECPPPIVEVKQDSLDKYYPCMVKEVLNKLSSNQTYGKLIQPFQSILLPNGAKINVPGLPNLTFGFSVQPYGGSGNEYMLGNTGRTAPTFTGTSSQIEFNSSAINNASALFLQMAAVHEVAHAYANYYIKVGSYGFPIDTTRYSTWAMNIVNFENASKNQIANGNYTDHSLFLENYVANFVEILKSLNGTNYTDKQYQMAALYGLDNAGTAPNPSTATATEISAYNAIKVKLNTSYANLITKYGITSTEKNSFYVNNLINVPLNKKIPTNCP